MKYLFILLLSLPLFSFSCDDDRTEAPQPTGLKAQAEQRYIMPGDNPELPLDFIVTVRNQWGQVLPNNRVKIERRNCEYDFSSNAKWYTTNSKGQIILKGVSMGMWQFWAEGKCYEQAVQPNRSCYSCWNYTQGGTYDIGLYIETVAAY